MWRPQPEEASGRADDTVIRRPVNENELVFSIFYDRVWVFDHGDDVQIGREFHRLTVVTCM